MQTPLNRSLKSCLDELNINMRRYKSVTRTTGFNATAKLVVLMESTVVLIKLPLVLGVELNITIAGQEKEKPSIVYLNLMAGETHDAGIRLRTNDAEDMNLPLTFRGLDFAKD